MSQNDRPRTFRSALMATTTETTASVIVVKSTQRDGTDSAARVAADCHPDEAFKKLSERQRVYLRHVAQNRTSKEIAQIECVSARAVDKQLILAKNLIGATTRADAARRLIAFEAGVGCLHPANTLPVQKPVHPLPLPVPNRRMPVNLIKARVVLIWSAIIGIAITFGLASATMLITALMILFGTRST